jgi:hypothetical protein
MKIKHCISHVASCLLAARKDELFHRLPAGKNKNWYSTRKYKLKFVAGWPTNKLTNETQSKTKNYKK